MRMLENNLLLFRGTVGRYVLNTKSENEGYVYVRRVTITPTRTIHGPRELMMGNRVLRFDPINFPPDAFIRVVFRDEDFSRPYASNMHYRLVRGFVGKPIRWASPSKYPFLIFNDIYSRDGIWIGG